VPSGFKAGLARVRTERTGVAVVLESHILEVLSLNLGRDIGYPELFRCFPQSLHTNAGIVP
jgi:hypothetical protein